MIKYISADSRYLYPLIIQLAATYQSSQITYPTPRQHFTYTKIGYTNIEISLYQVEYIFNLQTRDRVGSRPRLLIYNSFGIYKSLEVMKFCFTNRIILYRLPSYISYKLQLYDRGVFSPLKTAYQVQAKQVYRARVNTINKPYFTYIYDLARKEAFIPRNIRLAQSRSGLFLFDLSRVLQEY